MGLFLNQHVNYKEYTERRAQNSGNVNGYYSNYNNYSNNCGCGNYNFGSVLVNMLPSILALGINALEKDDEDIPKTKNTPKSKNSETSSPSAKSSSDNEENKAIQEKIDGLKEQITKVLSSEAGVETAEALDAKINSENGNLNQLQRSIEGDNSIESLNNQLINCYDENNNVKPGYEERVKELNDKLTETQNIIDTKIPDKKLEIGKLEATKVQIDNINQQIEVLEKKKEDNADGYSISQETKDINNFMKALKEFQNNPSDPYAAKALQQAYEQDCGNGHTSVQKAWSMVSDKVEAVLNK